MPTWKFVTVDVFTTERFGGNPLAVFPDAAGLGDAQMQALAREFNLSETTFVLPPENPANTARVRIFTPAREMPFAGHPNVGTGWVLAQAGRARDGMLRFEEIAGLVEVRVEGEVVTIAAPQPLSFGPKVDPALVAACIGCDTAAVLTGAHAPVLASTGNPFFFAEVTPDALTHASPDIAAFRAAAAAVPDAPAGRFALHIYAHDGGRLRTRMFAPPLGVLEDPATGSANVTLGALLLSLSADNEGRYEIVQGVEMGRPSLLHVNAKRAADGIRATVGGTCVPVLRGEVEL
jgi:trans-2,3-dihydro-3-hydroxyanthranilate isomerase